MLEKDDGKFISFVLRIGMGIISVLIEEWGELGG
jgi:hypothetical protein